MKQPEQFQVKGKEHLVCKLKRSIYGLKESSRCWNEALDKHLKKMGFKQSKNDPCIYILNSGGEIFIIAVYVNNIILAGKTSECIQKLINAIAELSLTLLTWVSFIILSVLRLTIRTLEVSR